MNRPGIGAIVNDQDAGYFTSAEELEAVAHVFFLAAQALREGKHGNITCKSNGDFLAEVSIHQPGGEFDERTGLPQLLVIVPGQAA